MRNYHVEAAALQKKMQDQTQGGEIISFDDVRNAAEIAKATGSMDHRILYVGVKQAREEGQAILEQRHKEALLKAIQK
jgi:hypothetical protein